MEAMAAPAMVTRNVIFRSGAAPVRSTELHLSLPQQAISVLTLTNTIVELVLVLQLVSFALQPCWTRPLKLVRDGKAVGQQFR